MMAQNPNNWWGDLNISHEFGVLIMHFQQHRIRDYNVAA